MNINRSATKILLKTYQLAATDDVAHAVDAVDDGIVILDLMLSIHY